MSAFHHELKLAEQVVLKAAALTKTVLASAQEILKADSSPVTVADFAAQALIIHSLRSAFPHDSFVGEEDASALRGDEALRHRVFQHVSSVITSEEEMMDLIDLGGGGQGGAGRFWVMDPVDGTATFLRNEQYAVSLALIVDGREAVGVLCCPNLRLDGGRIREDGVDAEGLGVMLSAARGQGASMRVLKREATLPPATRLERREMLGGLGGLHFVDCAASKSSHPGLAGRLAERLGARYPGTDVWSSHVRYAALVIGGGDVLLRVPLDDRSGSCIWDHAGAQLIYREVGGRVTDLRGREIDFAAGRKLDANYGLVAAAEGIHDEILRLTRELLQE